jgi:hypothetical protein
VRDRLETLLKENKPLEIVRVLNEAVNENQTRIIPNGLDGKSALEISGLIPVLFGERKDDIHVTLVKDIVSCVDKLVPYSKYKTMARLINYYCDQDDPITAVKYYDALQESSLAIDALSFEKFLGKLCENAMVDEIEIALKNQSPSITMAERMIEPYILSGRVFEFSQHFPAMLASEEIFSNLLAVKNFVEALLKSRLRRAISGAPKTLSEMVGLEAIHNDLTKFHSTLENMFYMAKHPSGYGQCSAIICNYLDYCSEWDDDTIPSPLNLAPDLVDNTQVGNTNLTFKYIVEHRNFHDNGSFLEESPFEVLDITAELGSDKLKPPLLYRADLFYTAQEDDQKFVSLICNDALELPLLHIFDEALEELGSLENGDEGGDGDSDDDDDVENDDEFELGDNEDEFDDFDEMDNFEAVDAITKVEDSRQRKAMNKSALQKWDVQFDDEEQTEEPDKLAASNPRRRINDLSRSLYASFGRYKPMFEEDFFYEMELLSYEDPKDASLLLKHQFVPKGGNPGDSGGVLQGTDLPVDAEFGK